MSFIDPLARSIERFVYERVCALSELVSTDHGGIVGPDTLASPLDGNESHPRRR